jgi:succinate dehydrogenase / fumarate reductase iron-sulfur subunit
MRAAFTVQRFYPSLHEGASWSEYEVELEEGATVLEALELIKDQQDGSLTFRRSCRSAICGSCAMHINGRQALACKTQVKGEMEKYGQVKLQPLPTFRVIRDLVVDMEPFWQKLKAVKPWLIADPAEPEPERERLMSRQALAKLEAPSTCILCAVCYSDCPIEGQDWPYLGPAALLRAYRFVEDPRDRGTAERMAIVASEQGIWRCRTVFNCAEACPKGINGTVMIQALKRRASLDKLRFWAPKPQPVSLALNRTQERD